MPKTDAKVRLEMSVLDAWLLHAAIEAAAEDCADNKLRRIVLENAAEAIKDVVTKAEREAAFS